MRCPRKDRHGNPEMMTWVHDKYPATQKAVFQRRPPRHKQTFVALSVTLRICPPIERPPSRQTDYSKLLTPRDRTKNCLSLDPLSSVQAKFSPAIYQGDGMCSKQIPTFCQGKRKAGSLTLPKAKEILPHQKGPGSPHPGLHCIMGRFSASARKTNDAFILHSPPPLQ